MAASMGASGNFTLNGDNGGTQIVDSNNRCYHRATTNYGPKEWGAQGSGSSTDTAPLQNWLNANQPHIGDADNYTVFSPLTCPANTTVQGPANLMGNANTAVFSITADPTFSGLLPADETLGNSQIYAQSVIGALGNCRLSGVSVAGNGYYLPTTGTVPATGNCITGVGSTVGLQSGNYVVWASIPAQTVVQQIGMCSGANSVTVSGSLSCSSGCSNEPITFYGPDVVDVLANGVVIDGFSALSNGGNNLVCLNTVAKGAGLQVKDSQVASARNNNIVGGGCPDARFIGDRISAAGMGEGGGSGCTSTCTFQACWSLGTTCTGTGLYWGGDDLTLADGVIEESNGIGLDLETAQKISVSGMHFQGNGQSEYGGPAIQINGSHEISICGNHMEGNGGAAIPSAHFYFSGALDNVNICGNTYLAQSLANAVFQPSYVYDAAPGTTVTNFHLYDSPAPQASGQIYTLNAGLILPQLQIPAVPQKHIAGLTLSNDGSVANQIDISSGEATDSTNSVNIALPQGCSVNPTVVGQGGLDVTGGLAANSTYYYFAIGSASGGNASCIASTNLIPSFANAAYPLIPQGETQAGVPYIYNLTTIAGLAPNQLINNNSYMANGTTTGPVGTFTLQQAGSFGTSVNTIQFTNVTNMGKDMQISDRLPISGSSCAPAGVIPVNPAYDTIASVNSTMNQVTLNENITGSPPSNDCITISSGNAVMISGNASHTTNSGPQPFTIWGGVYRLIGALYTGPTANVVGFYQDGDTFYLDVPKMDINLAAVAPTTLYYPLSSIPSGIAVEALGRCTATVKVHVFRTLLTPGVPAAFPLQPGFDTETNSPDTAFPYRIYTDTMRRISAQGSSSGTMDCATDGWVFHRGQ